jgi:hypothetical protein
MKKVKLILCFVLCLHFLGSFIVNLSGLDFSENVYYKTKINTLGKFVTTAVRKIRIPEGANSLMSYTVYTGTNKGYEFFSPNIPASKTEFLFFANEKPITMPLVSHESKTKFFTATVYLEKYFHTPELRDQILRSISLRLLSLKPEIKKIKIDLKITHFDSLSIYKNEKHAINIITIPGFTLVRHD